MALDTHEKMTAGTFDPAAGYDIASEDYDSWHWSRFWVANEVPEVLPLLRKVKNGTVLDAGCGTGRYCPLIRTTKHDYIGADVSRRMVEINARKASRDVANTNFVVADIRRLPLKAHSIEAVLCARVLSHVEDLISPLAEFRRVLKRGGLCILTDVHSEHPYQYTKIPTSHGEVAIDTFKHTPRTLIEAFHHFEEYEILQFQSYKLGDLRVSPPRQQFGKIYLSPDNPIFWICLLRIR